MYGDGWNGQKFQFHKGTIKTSAPIDFIIIATHFNSIKVRLKLDIQLPVQNILALFQFHKGTIKTGVLVGGGLGCTGFQFHKGTIKTLNYCYY